MTDPHPFVGTDIAARGVRLHLIDHGVEHGSGDPLLLLPGIPTTGYLWHDVVRELEHTHRCVVPDLVGLGDSEAPADRGAYALGEQAATMLALLDHLGLERVAVAGHDIGGTVAVLMAQLAPERVSALALLSPLLHADLWPVASARSFLPPVLGEASVAALATPLGPRILRQAIDPDLPAYEAKQYLAGLRTGSGRAGMLRVFRSIDAAGAQAALPGLAEIPTLLLWGEQDRVHPLAYGARCAADLPAARFVPVSGGGHLLPTRMPGRVAEEIRLTQSADQ